MSIHYSSLLHAAELIRRREVSAEQLVQATLERIAALDPGLASFITLTGETAIMDARRADAEIAAGFYRGPLHGVPIGLKDQIDMEGVPTIAGLAFRRSAVADQDATVTRRLRQAGAILIGKLQMTEGGTTEHHPSFVRPQNPWSPAHWSGASSTGSATALAAGLCHGALGTDAGGSIRLPASVCGITGLKPTWGRVSRRGVLPTAESFCHVGPMARSAADAAALLQAIAGPDPADTTTLAAAVPDYLAELRKGIAGLVIGVDWSFATENVDADVAAAFRGAVDMLSDLGAQIRPLTLPPTDQLCLEAAVLILAESAHAHRDTFASHPQHYGAALRRMLEAGGGIVANDLVDAALSRARFGGALNHIFGQVDALLTPTIPIAPPRWEEIDEITRDFTTSLKRVTRYTLPFNFTGHPALTVPAGIAASGVPIGVQIVGPALGEAVVLRIGHRFQQVTDHHVQRPPVSA